jgi:hypothetical protein
LAARGGGQKDERAYTDRGEGLNAKNRNRGALHQIGTGNLVQVVLHLHAVASSFVALGETGVAVVELVPQPGMERLADACDGADGVGWFVFDAVAVHGTGETPEDIDRAFEVFQCLGRRPVAKPCG